MQLFLLSPDRVPGQKNLILEGGIPRMEDGEWKFRINCEIIPHSV